MDRLYVAMQIKLHNMKEALEEKMNADDKLVVALVLIAVAVGLCIIFRNEINALVTNIFKSTGSQVNSLYSGSLS